MAKKIKQTTSLDQAVVYIQTKISDGVWLTGTKIPSCRSIALSTGIGFGSVFKAIKILKAQKLLSGKEKVGVFVGDTIPQPSKHKLLNEKIPKCEKVKELLKKDVLQGSFHEMEFLPSIKELQIIYETSYQILKASIDSLVNEGILKPSKRRFRILHFNVTTASNTVFLVMSKEALGNELWSVERACVNEFIRSLEKETMKKGIRLIKHQAGTPFPQTIPDIHILGFIVWFDIAINSIINTGLLNVIFRYKKPVALINRIYDIGKKWAQDYYQWIGIDKTIANTFTSDMDREIDAGYNIGKFLIGKGHKKICFIAHAKDEQIVDQVGGIDKAFCDSGRENSVKLFCVNDFTGEVSNSSLSKNSTRQTLEQKNKLFDDGLGIFARIEPQSLAERYNRQIQEWKFACNYLQYYTPAFEKALDDSAITAWVCKDDSLACNGAMEFLKSRKVKVPNQIGVMGCSDLSESSFSNLTSYQYDYAGAARTMLSLIVYPEYSKKSLCVRGTNVFKVEGMVIDRGSV